MELDQAILLVARSLEADTPALELTGRVREAIVAMALGRPLDGVAPEALAAIQGWIRRAGEATGDGAGALYQELLRRVISRTAGGVAVQHRRGEHRSTGAYYTRNAIVQYMLERARVYLPNARTLVDPACGSGAFLAGAAEVFGTGLERLVGLDSDVVALGLCQLNVPSAELIGMDALLDDCPGGFDLCIGNPPYISSGLRGMAAPDPRRAEALKQRFPHTSQYKLNTYPLFIERGLELLRDGGVLGYIVPDSFLAGRYFAGARDLLLRHTLEEVTLVCEDFWEHGRVGQSVILFVRKGPPPQGHTVRIKVCDSVRELATARESRVALSDLVWGAVKRFRLVPDASLRSLLRGMESGPRNRPLGEHLQAYSGLIGREGQASLLRSQNGHLPGPWGRLLRSGREIDRYRLTWSGEEVCLDPHRIKSGGHFPYYQQPKLLLRQTADSLRAVYDDQGYYCLNNIHVLVPKAGAPDIRALLGVINSAPVDRYYRACAMESGRLYAQVDLDMLAALPVPPVTADLVTLVRARESAAPGEAAPIEQRIDDLVARLYDL